MVSRRGQGNTVKTSALGATGTSYVARAWRRAWSVARTAAVCATLGLGGCTHRLVVETTPPDALVHALDDKGRRTKLLGRSPLVLEDAEGSSLQGLLIEKPGFVPRRIDVPFAASSDVRLDVDLQGLDREFVAALPPEALRAVIDAKMGDLVSFQQTLFATNPEEAEREIAAQEPKLGGTAAFHYIVGSWQFYLGRYDDATRSFRRSLELAPDFSQARRMLVLTDVKSVSRTQVARTRAFGTLQAAASEVATLGDGYLVRTKSNDSLAEPDGFEMILPSDGIFKPTTAKIRKDSLPLLTQLAGEMKKLDQAFAVTVEAHTDSDFSAEMRNVPGAVVSGKPSFKNAWELSSARATAVLELLRSEGVSASLWNISGYGDSRPLVVRAKNDGGQAVRPPSTSNGGIAATALPADGSLTRRVVVRVSLLGRTVPVPSVSLEESERLKARLKMFLENDDDDAQLAKNRSRLPEGTSEGGALAPERQQRARSPSKPFSTLGRTQQNQPAQAQPAQAQPAQSQPAQTQTGQTQSAQPSNARVPTFSQPELGDDETSVPIDAAPSRGTAIGSTGPAGSTGPTKTGSPSIGRAPTAGSPSRQPAAAPGSSAPGRFPTSPAQPGGGQPQKQNAQGKSAGGTALSAKPMPGSNQSNTTPIPVSPYPKRSPGPKPIRDVAPNAIPRPRIPSLRPQTGTGSGTR